MSDDACRGSELRPCDCGLAFCPENARGWIDLGGGCFAEWHGGEPGNQERLLILHRTPAGEECWANIGVDSPAHHALPPERRSKLLWKVESWDPVTLSPSIACGCGAHGWVRAGKWVSA